MTDMFFNSNTMAFVIVVNIFLFLSAILKLLQRKHIINFLMVFSIVPLVILELGKLSLIFDLEATDKLIGFGFCLMPLFWLIMSVSLLPSKSYSISRVVLTPLLSLFSLIFFLVWWIEPFMGGIYQDTIVNFSPIARYFFVLLIFSASLVVSNLERSLYHFKKKHIRHLFLSALLLLGPYVFISVYSVILSNLSSVWIVYSSVPVLFGSVFLLISCGRDYSIDAVREDTAVHTSVSLFLIGGYLFFVGGFIKLFQVFGWNLNVLFSILTTLFVVMTFLFLLSSGSFRERLRERLLKNLTHQQYDWQKLWSEFTYKISLVNEINKINECIKEAVKKIVVAVKVEVILFEEELPFEKEFCDWLLRYAGPLSFDEFLNNDSSAKFPQGCKFFKDRKFTMIVPLYGEKSLIGVIGVEQKSEEIKYFDKELLKVLSLQASSAIISCRSYQKMAEADRKESLYKMSSFIIHDIKNYVNSLSLLVENKDKFTQKEFLDDALFTLENTIGKMNLMMDEFKSLRGDLSLNKGTHLVAELIDEAIKDIGSDRLNDIEVVKEIDNSLAVDVDSYYMNRVLYNLITNSIDAMNAKGKLIFSTEVANGSIGIVIGDTGRGMSREFIETKLFKPFSSTKQRGLGIGTYQCRTIVEAHSGMIEAESQIDKGSNFRISLPMVCKS
jgi:putative PEP-CTERM system histidine kinase